MVLDNDSGYYQAAPAEQGHKRPLEARKLSYQKMQESSVVGQQSKKGRESSKTGDHGAWGPVFQNRQKFNDMHMF